MSFYQLVERPNTWIYFLKLVVLQWVGTAFGVVQVLMARQNNVHNYLFGIVAILISIYGCCTNPELYADILSEPVLSGHEHLWLVLLEDGKATSKRRPSPTPMVGIMVMAAGIVLGCFLLMAYWLGQHTDSDVPYWDAVVVAFAWAGMWLMAKRKIENWVYLNISNLISVPLLIYKELYIYAGLTAFLFTVAISGYIKWKRIIDNERNKAYA